jgi:Actin
MVSEELAAEGDGGSFLLLNQPVVIDNGTSNLKAGFAGSSKPKARLLHVVENCYQVLQVIQCMLALTLL